MRVKSMRHVAAAGAAALALLLAGCGGGGSAEPAASTSDATTAPAPDTSGTPVVSAADPVVPTQTLPQYLASASAPAAAPTIGAAAQAQNYNDSRLLANALLSQAMGASGAFGVVAVPPLVYAQLDLWRAAASGDTLAQLNRLFPATADPALAQARSHPVVRELSAAAGAGFTPAFLDASRLPNLDEQSQRWRVGESTFGDPNLRLQVQDKVSQHLDLPTPQAFQGVFQGEDLLLLSQSMVRIDAGVRHVAGSDHEAEVLDLGARRLIALRPLAGTLADFVAQGRWVPALDQVNDRLGAGQATPGSLVLPDSMGTYMKHREWLGQQGLDLPFDLVNANLRALDGQGGTHVETSESGGGLKLGATGLDFSASTTSSFLFSPLNVNGPGSSFGVVISVGGGTSRPPGGPPDCPHADVDLRPFFLVLIDEFKAVQWAAAILNLPAGVQCAAPSTSFTFPSFDIVVGPVIEPAIPAPAPQP